MTLHRPAARQRPAFPALCLFAFALLPACELPYAAPPECPGDTELRGNKCVPAVDLAPADPRELIAPDAGPEPGIDAGGPDPAEDAGPEPEVDAGPDPGPDGGPDPQEDAGAPPDYDTTLPFFIEDHYVMSGLFSETGAPTVVRTECSGVQGTKPDATCIGIDYSPNGDSFGGFFFQHPENNFGASPGLSIPPGARQVRFRAWGASGDELVKFGAGIDNTEPFSDGFNVETAVRLTDTPTQYFVDLRGVTYSTVAGGFFWVVDTPTGTGDLSFFMDNIEWTTEAPVVTGLPIPFWVDDHYIMSGFFPGPPASVAVQEGCSGFSGTDPASVCRRVTLTPNGQTFAGFYFQFPENNFGAQPGKLIAPGATEITFRAWGATGSEVASFGAGLDNDLPNEDGWNVETTPAALPTTPTEYSVNISGVGYDRVGGAFFWVLQAPDGVTPVTFYLDNIRWQ